jgi:hypothetical protein
MEAVPHQDAQSSEHALETELIRLSQELGRLPSNHEIDQALSRVECHLTVERADGREVVLRGDAFRWSNIVLEYTQDGNPLVHVKQQ